MFGKGGGALGAWIKEFCQLVFIQTIQAFIYAIIITVIMSLYTQAVDIAENNSEVDYATSLGLFSVVALTSVFKIEDIARRLFGFGPTKADHGGAVKSIAKTAFALKLGGRVLDNAKKVGTGAKNWLGANKDAKKAASRLNRRMEAFNKDNEGDGISESKGASQRRIDSEKRDEKLKLFADAQKARRLAQTETDPNKKKALIDEAKRKLAESKAIDDTLKDSGIESRTSSRTGGKSGNYHQTLLNLQEQYEKELSDAKKKRKEGFRTMTKGVMETGGAIIGGTAGGILGFADGNLDEGIQGAIGGAGFGDAVGSFATDTVFGANDLVDGAVKATTGAVKDYSKNIAKQYQDEKKAIELSAGQTAKAMAKAVGKGSAKAYKSRHGGIKELSNSIKDLENHINTVSKDVKLDNNVESID